MRLDLADLEHAMCSDLFRATRPITVERNRQGIDVFYVGLGTATSPEAAHHVQMAGYSRVVERANRWVWC